MRELKTDNVPYNGEFYVLMGGDNCPKCVMAKKAIDKLGLDILWCNAHKDRRMTKKMGITGIPALVHVRSTAGVHVPLRTDYKCTSQKAIKEFVDCGDE